MQTFAQRQDQTARPAPRRVVHFLRARFEPEGRECSARHPQSTSTRRIDPPALRTAVPQSGAGAPATARGWRGHDFGRLSVLDMEPGTTATAAARDAATRCVDGKAAGDQVVTSNGHPAPAPGATAPTPPVAKQPVSRCQVTAGPTYSPSGSIPVTLTGGRKRATFKMTAAFGAGAAGGHVPSCCQVRQYIKWDKAFHTWRGGPPHGGFPATSTQDTWYEDRDSRDKRYGHRSGPHSDPIAGCGDEYKTGGVLDQKNGDRYCGRDTPSGPKAMTGAFFFQLKVVDACNGDAVKASSAPITVNW